MSGHHINKDGDFQSDKHPFMKPNKLMLSFKDKEARIALKVFAKVTKDRELGEDILEVLNKWK